jgi:hypothetical protein
VHLTTLIRSAFIPFLLGAAGLVAWCGDSIADESGNQQQAPQTGMGMSQDDLAKIEQDAMEMFKEMQKSGLIPSDVEIPTSSRSQSGGAEVPARTASTGSSPSKNSPPPSRTNESSADKSWVKPLLKPNVEYVGTSYTGATGPGMSPKRHPLTIHHGSNMAHFQSSDKGQSSLIYRYDKGVIWGVIPEQAEYPGLKFYQEFELQDGTGFDSHVDQIMLAYAVLKYPEKLENLGRETINGFETTHYQKREAIPWLSNTFSTTDYWLSDQGILMKVTSSGEDPRIVQILETKDVQIGKQPEHFFVPPPDYKKAGNVIDFAEEKKKRSVVGGK